MNGAVNNNAYLYAAYIVVWVVHLFTQAPW